MPRTLSGLLGMAAEAAHLMFNVGHGAAVLTCGLLAGACTCCLLADRWSNRLMAVEAETEACDRPDL